MPLPKRPCTYPGCRTLTDGRSSRCPVHTQERRAWKGTASETGRRLTGRALQAARAALFAERPLCAECERNGRVRAATKRDHIVPVAEGGTEDPSNIQGLCEDCHDVKSEQERKRGIKRWNGNRK